MSKRYLNQGTTCITEGCDEEARCKKLCRACYQWERYHLGLQHGSAYFRKYVKKHSRLVNRAEDKLSGSNVRKFRARRAS